MPLYEEACKTNDPAKLLEFIELLYPTKEPSVSYHESSLGSASCVTAIGFEKAMMGGKNEKDLQDVYVDIGRRFMRHHN